MTQTWRALAEAESARAAETVAGEVWAAVPGVDCHHVRKSIYGYAGDRASAAALVAAISSAGVEAVGGVRRPRS